MAKSASYIETSKTRYFFILLLLSVQFWQILPLGLIWDMDVNLVATLLWCIYGVNKYKKYSSPIHLRKYMKLVIYIFLGIFLSFIMCQLFHNQGILHSFVTSRLMACYLVIPTLLIVQPSVEGIMKAFKVFGIMYLIILLTNLFSPFPITAQKLNYIKLWQSGEITNTYDFEHQFGAYVDGFPLLIYPMYYYLNLMKKKLNLNYFLWGSFFYLLIFMEQNRSLLFPATFVYIYYILTLKNSKMLSITIFVIIIFAINSKYIQQTIADLTEKTTTNISDTDYNRNKAYTYFLTKASPNVACKLFGNGSMSSRESKEYREIRENGIYNSDVGFIGFWNQYGLIPIIVFLTILFRTLLEKKTMPMYLKLVALTMIVDSLTISYFADFSMWFFLLFYLYASYKEKTVIKYYSHNE